MGAVLRASVLFIPLVLVWRLAGPPWDAVSAALVGLAMLAGVALGRPWTAWVSGRDWSGMQADPLFHAINRALSLLWGGVLLVCAAAWQAGWAGPWHWLPMALAGAVSALVPPLWVRAQLRARLRAADPHPWASPLLTTAAALGPADDAVLDVAVVGAGIGGLTAAALLARAGARVAVYEQHDKPGGFCHCWEGTWAGPQGLQRFRFDAGVHDISGVFAGGTVDNLLQRLNLAEVLDWRRLDHAFIDRHGVRWDAPRGWEAFVQALQLRCPQDAGAVASLMADVRAIFDAMYASAPARGGVPGAPDTPEGLQAFARAHPLAVRWMTQPFEALLDHHRLGEPARVLLRSLAGYVTHDARQLTVADQVPLLGYFLHGGHYPVGGSGALAQALADSLALDGGTLHLSSLVRAVQLQPDGSGVHGLMLADGRQVRARTVVLASDAMASLSLLQPAHAVPPALAARLQALTPATSMFSVHLGVHGDPPALPAVLHLHDAQGHPLEMVLPCVADPSAAPPGCFTVELMRLVPPGQARSWFQEPDSLQAQAQRACAEYRARKAELANAMIDAAAAWIPNLGARIVMRHDASPVTFRRFGASSFGSVYGALDADGRPARLPRRSPVPGLVFAGAATRGAGVEPAMISGAEAADALLPGLLARGTRLASPGAGASPAGTA